MRFSAKYQRGQILLIVILIMVVTLTVGLSVISHTVTTLRTTKDSESSQRAFSAAEAGIEKLLNTNTNTHTLPSTTLSNGSSFSGSVSTVSGSFVLINNLSPVFQDDGVDVWLSNYSTYTNAFTGTIKVYWGIPRNDCSSAAVELLLVSGTKANPVITHTMVDPCAARRVNNKFVNDQAGGQLGTTTFNHGYSLDVTNGLLLRIIPLYEATVMGVGVVTGPNLPAQGQNLVSTGTSGGATRKITVFKGFPRLPMEFFSYVLFNH